MSSNPLGKFTQITLTATKVCCSQFFGEFSCDQMQLNVEPDFYARQFRGMLWTYVMSETLKEKTEEVTFSYPASWWQHFKAECFPEWLRKRYPVRMTVETRHVHFSAKEIYPMFAEKFPDDAKLHRTQIDVWIS